MQRLELGPEKLIVPGEYEVGNDEKLSIYFRIFAKRGRRLLPPSLVISARGYTIDEMLSDEYEFREAEAKSILEMDIQDFGRGRYKGFWTTKEEIFEHNVRVTEFSKKCHATETSLYSGLKGRIEDLLSKDATHFLIDGNHRSIAATLAHQPIVCLEIETPEDIVKIKKLVEKGELPEPHLEKAEIKPLYQSLYEHLRNKTKLVATLREGVDSLVENGDLPDYMIKLYKTFTTPTKKHEQ